MKRRDEKNLKSRLHLVWIKEINNETWVKTNDWHRVKK